jgi:hypothetical protein
VEVESASRKAGALHDVPHAYAVDAVLPKMHWSIGRFQTYKRSLANIDRSLSSTLAILVLFVAAVRLDYYAGIPRDPQSQTLMGKASRLKETLPDVRIVPDLLR